MWKGIYTSMANCRFLQVLLLHLGTYKRMCSLMRKVSLHVNLPGWKTIKFPLIWYIIYWFSWKSFLKNLNLKNCLLSFFAECTLCYFIFIYLSIYLFILPPPFFLGGGGGGCDRDIHVIFGRVLTAPPPNKKEEERKKERKKGENN